MHVNEMILGWNAAFFPGRPSLRATQGRFDLSRAVVRVELLIVAAQAYLSFSVTLRKDAHLQHNLPQVLATDYPCETMDTGYV